jgi:hypothetical protein
MAALDSPLTDALRDLMPAKSPKGGSAPSSPGWSQVTGLRRLTDACAPMCTTHRPPGPPEAAALRAVALALADGATAGGTNAPGVLRTAAATVTLVENRSKGESTTGESILLALV